MHKEKYKKIEQGIKEVKEQLTSAYPKTAEEVIEYHNKIMNYQYSRYMQEEYVKPAVEIVRMLYSKEILGLNLVESQEESLLKEIQANQQQSVFILQSKIISTRYDSEETTAVVKVIHSTNIKDMTREYMLIKEDGNWKISGWNSVEEEQ